MTNVSIYLILISKENEQDRTFSGLQIGSGILCNNQTVLPHRAVFFGIKSSALMSCAVIGCWSLPVQSALVPLCTTLELQDRSSPEPPDHNRMQQSVRPLCELVSGFECI